MFVSEFWDELSYPYGTCKPEVSILVLGDAGNVLGGFFFVNFWKCKLMRGFDFFFEVRDAFIGANPDAVFAVGEQGGYFIAWQPIFLAKLIQAVEAVGAVGWNHYAQAFFGTYP